MKKLLDNVALYALTESGAETVAKLAEKIGHCKIFLPDKLRNLNILINMDTEYYHQGCFSEVLQNNWKKFKNHIFIMATGIVVRKIAPLLEDKTKDPAVVVCDEKGDFAISLLSGHIGGANRLAKFAASVLGGESVITTATDVQGIMAFDELAAIQGWVVENPENIKILNSLLLEGKKIAVDIPEDLYEKCYKNQRKNIFHIKSLEELEKDEFDGAVILDFDNESIVNIPLLLLRNK